MANQKKNKTNKYSIFLSNCHKSSCFKYSSRKKESFSKFKYKPTITINLQTKKYISNNKPILKKDLNEYKELFGSNDNLLPNAANTLGGSNSKKNSSTSRNEFVSYGNNTYHQMVKTNSNLIESLHYVYLFACCCTFFFSCFLCYCFSSELFVTLF